MRRIIAGMAVIGVAWLALAQGQTLNRGVYEQGTNTISGAKFFLNGLWIGTNAQVTVNASNQLVSVVNGVTNLLGGASTSTKRLLRLVGASAASIRSRSGPSSHSASGDGKPSLGHSATSRPTSCAHISRSPGLDRPFGRS